MSVRVMKRKKEKGHVRTGFMKNIYAFGFQGEGGWSECVPSMVLPWRN